MSFWKNILVIFFIRRGTFCIESFFFLIQKNCFQICCVHWIIIIDFLFHIQHAVFHGCEWKNHQKRKKSWKTLTLLHRETENFYFHSKKLFNQNFTFFRENKNYVNYYLIFFHLNSLNLFIHWINFPLSLSLKISFFSLHNNNQQRRLCNDDYISMITKPTIHPSVFGFGKAEIFISFFIAIQT